MSMYSFQNLFQREPSRSKIKGKIFADKVHIQLKITGPITIKSTTLDMNLNDKNMLKS